VILAKNLCIHREGITQKSVLRSISFSPILSCFRLFPVSIESWVPLLHGKKVSQTWQHWGEHVLLLPGAPIDALLVDIHSTVVGVAALVRLVVDGVHLA